MGTVRLYPTDQQLSENFRVREFRCPCGQCGPEFPIDDALVVYLQKIRDHFGAPVNISSGYRCQAFNQKAGGSENSNHKKGRAADIWVEGYLKNPRAVAQYAESIGIPGIGLYEGSKGQYFVHIDSRDSRSYWESHDNSLVSSFFPAQEATVQVALPVLKKGSRGEAVKAMQQLLNGHGHKLEVDGSFGTATEAALKAYQAAKGLASDGSCGAITWTNLTGGA